MKITKIRETVCADCGCEADGFEVANKHSNGMWNERVWFPCGKEVRFSANFNEVATTAPCKRSAKFKALQASYEPLRANLKQLVSQSDLSGNARRRILSQLDEIIQYCSHKD